MESEKISIQHLYGHEVYYDWDISKFRYKADGMIVNESDPRPCVRCNKKPLSSGEDNCLGILPGVKNACCGHGVKEGYFEFKNGVTVRFDNMRIEYQPGTAERGRKIMGIKKWTCQKCGKIFMIRPLYGKCPGECQGKVK